MGVVAYLGRSENNKGELVLFPLCVLGIELRSLGWRQVPLLMELSLALPQNLLGKIHNFCYECQVSRFLKPVLTMTFGFLLPNPSGYRADSKKLPASFQYLL